MEFPDLDDLDLDDLDVRDMNSNVTKVKPSSEGTSDSGKPSSEFVSSGFPSNLVNTKKKNVENHFDDSTKSRSRVMQIHSQRLKADNAEVGSENNLTELSSEFSNSESEVNQDNDWDSRSESNTRVPANSCSDENSFPYSEYEKEEPELKGPITTISQHKEYVQVYRDKYEIYLSLRKILLDFSDELQKIGDELECAKRKGDMERYHDIAEQIKETYRRFGSRHKRQKKIFIVLHGELVNIKQRLTDFVQSRRN